MNVVPYIDVMLVLLVIFMVTAPMLNQGVKVDLPKVSSEALPQDNNSRVLTISIKADQSYFWNMGKRSILIRARTLRVRRSCPN
jgi:biopolymer transport protein TolR